MSESMISISMVIGVCVMTAGLKRFFKDHDKKNNPSAYYDEDKNYDLEREQQDL